MDMDYIINSRLNAVQEQWSVGILSKVMQTQQTRAEGITEAIRVAGIGENLDVYA